MRYFLLLPALLFTLGAATGIQADEFDRQSDQRSWDFVQTATSGKFDEKRLTLTLLGASPPAAATTGSNGLPTDGAGPIGDGWRDAVLSFDFKGKTFEARIRIRAAAYEGTTVSYDVRLISGALAECFDNPRMVFEAMKVASAPAAEALR